MDGEPAQHRAGRIVHLEQEDRVEVKIGVLHTPRELVVDTTQTQDEVQQLVADALKSVDGQLSLTDERGRRVIVPANLVAYVEIAQADARRVGFVTD